MIGLTETVDILTATIVVVRGVESADWSNPTVESDVPAATYYTKSTADFDYGISFYEEIRVIMEPRDFDARLNRIRWRGTVYEVKESARTHYRAGTPHHVSITLGAEV